MVGDDSALAFLDESVVVVRDHTRRGRCSFASFDWDQTTNAASIRTERHRPRSLLLMLSRPGAETNLCDSVGLDAALEAKSNWELQGTAAPTLTLIASPGATLWIPVCYGTIALPTALLVSALPVSPSRTFVLVHDVSEDLFCSSSGRFCSASIPVRLLEFERERESMCGYAS